MGYLDIEVFNVGIEDEHLVRALRNDGSIFWGSKAPPVAPVVVDDRFDFPSHARNM